MNRRVGELGDIQTRLRLGESSDIVAQLSELLANPNPPSYQFASHTAAISNPWRSTNQFRCERL